MSRGFSPATSDLRRFLPNFAGRGLRGLLLLGVGSTSPGVIELGNAAADFLL